MNALRHDFIESTEEGCVCDLVILANTHLDLGINTALWMPNWTEKHGDEKRIR